MKARKSLKAQPKNCQNENCKKIKLEYDGYIAKDQCGTVGLYLHGKPHKFKSDVAQGEWSNDEWDGPAISGEFPMLSWEDEEPTKVKITIEI